MRTNRRALVLVTVPVLLGPIWAWAGKPSPQAHEYGNGQKHDEKDVQPVHTANLLSLSSLSPGAILPRYGGRCQTCAEGEAIIY